MSRGRVGVRSRRDQEFTEYAAARLGELRRVAHLLCQDWQRADDLVQAALTRLYLHWGRASATEHVDGYARTILVREFLAERRSGWARRVSLHSAVPDVVATDAGDPDETLDIRAALARLPARQRATVVLRFYCDLNVEQTAALLGCTQGTIKSQTAKAISVLRLALGPVPGQPRSPDARGSEEESGHG